MNGDAILHLNVKKNCQYYLCCLLSNCCCTPSISRVPMEQLTCTASSKRYCTCYSPAQSELLTWTVGCQTPSVNPLFQLCSYHGYSFYHALILGTSPILMVPHFVPTKNDCGKDVYKHTEKTSNFSTPLFALFSLVFTSSFSFDSYNLTLVFSESAWCLISIMEMYYRNWFKKWMFWLPTFSIVPLLYINYIPSYQMDVVCVHRDWPGYQHQTSWQQHLVLSRDHAKI